MGFYVYMLRCADDTFYTGWTNDLKKRLAVHQRGKGARYTRSRLPVQLVYWERLNSKSEAMQREYSIKQLSRLQKEQLGKTPYCEGENNKLY